MFSPIRWGVAAATVVGVVSLVSACRNTLQFGSTGPESCGTPGAICPVGTLGVGDGGPELKADLVAPFGLATDAAGNTYVADTGNNRIRKIDLTGTITTIAGNGSGNADILEGLASEVSVPGPLSVAVDKSGAVYWDDSETCGIFRLDPVSNLVTIVAGGVGCGGSGNPTQGIGSRFGFNGCGHIALDSLGNILFPDNASIRYLNLSTNSVTVWGISVPGLSAAFVAGGDGAEEGNGAENGVQAITQYFNSPCTAFPDNKGRLFIADGGHQVIRLVNTTGGINNIAGSGAYGTSGDTGAALSAQFMSPDAFVIDPAGDQLFVFDQSDRIRLVNLGGSSVTWGGVTVAAGNIDTVAGGASFSPPQISGVTSDGAAALNQGMDFHTFGVPVGVLASAGDLLFPDPGGHVLRQVSAGSGFMSVLAGFGPSGTAVDFLEVPTGVALDPLGGLYLTSQTPYLLHVDLNGTVKVVAGNGKVVVTPADNGVPALQSAFWGAAIAVDAQGAVYVADPLNQLVRRIDPTGTITTVAGGGSSYGDGGPSSSAQFNGPWGIAVDDSANLFVADDSNIRFINRGITAVTVAKLTIAPGDIDTFAGGNGGGFSGDGGQAGQAQMEIHVGCGGCRFPTVGLGLGANHQLFVAENFGNRIRQIDLSTGIISTLIGSGVDAPDQVGEPTGLAVTGNVLYWAQSSGPYLKSITLPRGPVNVLAGDGGGGYFGDGGAGIDAELFAPNLIAFGPLGQIFIADGSHRIRVVQQ